MATFLQGNFFSTRDHEVCVFTGNSTITKQGNLVMGAGTAKVIKDNFPFIDLTFANLIYRICGNKGLFGYTQIENIGIFQTKTDWKLPSTLDILNYSVEKMLQKIDPSKIYRLPFPCIGNGGLSKHDVIPFISRLPDNVHIYEL